MEFPSVSNATGAAPGAVLGSLLAAHFADQALELPMLPTYATQVVALCSDPSSDARSLAQILQRDPSLAAHVLQIANSAAFGAREPIVSLQQAIARMGVRTLAEVALSVAVRTKIFRAGRHLERVTRIWKHSAVSAAWAREIARSRRHNVESAFLCGLLHEVGAPVVLQAIDDIQRKSSLEFSAAEIDVALDQFHTEVGERLVSTWKLPEWTRAAARYHHIPEQATESVDEVYTTHLADRLACFLEGEDDLSGLDATLSALSMYEDDLEALKEQTDAIRALAEALS